MAGLVGKRPPPLVDQYGKPIQFAVLRQEVAAPSVMSVRNIFSTHPAQHLTPRRLAQMLLEAEQSIPINYLDLAEEMEEKDLHYLGVLGTRKRAVAQLEITVEAADDSARAEADAKLIRDWLKREQLQMELFDILDAIGKGFSATEIIWEMSETQWMPCALKRRDPRWFRFDWVDGETLLLRDIGEDLPLPPFKFIDHRHPAKSGTAIRGGMARAVAWSWMFKNYTIKDWVAFAEVFGMPLRLGKHEVGETEDNIRKLAQAVSNIGSDAAAVISKSMEIEFIDGKKGSGGGDPSALYKGLADYCDQQVSKVVLGQTATTDAIAGGHAVGKIHNEVRRDILAADAVMLGATLNRDLVRPMVDLNNGPPPSGVYPKMRIGLPEAVDIKLLTDSLGTLVPMGVKVPLKWVRDKLGAPEPDEGEPVLTPPPTPIQAQPENAADRAEVSDLATDPAEAAASAFSRLSKLLKSQSKVGAAASVVDPTNPDSIDLGIDAALGDWRPLAEALIGPAEDLVAGCSSLEEVRDRLAGAIDAMSVDKIAQLIAETSFASRLAGIVGERL
jgi:phage gp29-like protein